MSISVLLADDHPIYRQGLAGYLAMCDGIEVAADVSSGTQAVEQALRLRPQVCVLDLAMPGLTGIEATTRIRSQAPEVAVLVLTMFDGEDAVFQAMRSGAAGYLVKSAEPELVANAIRVVAAGGVVLSAPLAARVAGWFAGMRREDPALALLTPREREVLALMAKGLATAVIADRLDLQDKTVRNVVSAVLTKLGVPDRAAAVARLRSPEGF